MFHGLGRCTQIVSPTSMLVTSICLVLLAKPNEIWGHLQPGQRYLKMKFLTGPAPPMSPESSQILP
jgi:hypothetical protein